MTTILITGGAGSLGRALINELLKPDNYFYIDSLPVEPIIRVLDINEHRLSVLKHKNIRRLYGSITDKDRVRRAMYGADIVIHCAALKNLEVTEFNTPELIKTNVVGTDIVISSAIENAVSKVMIISSDKAVEPAGIYGASKLISEHVALNYNATNVLTKISVFRSGNFEDSRGNVFEVWKRQLENNEPITVTDIKCFRYFIKTDIAAKTILKAVRHMEGGEIFIPDETIMVVKSMDTILKEAGVDKNYKIKTIGLRKGEKLIEQTCTVDEKVHSVHNKELKCWVIR